MGGYHEITRMVSLLLLNWPVGYDMVTLIEIWTEVRRSHLFFRKDYDAPGPGINPDAPEKTGPARLLEIVQLEAGSIFLLNLLFLLSCIPVVTIPPAIFAMNQVVRKMMLDKPVLCFYDYRTAFRTYWKQGYAAFFLTAVPLVLSGFGAWFYLTRAADNPVMFAPFLVCSTVLLVTLLSSGCLYGALGAGLGVRKSLRLALTLGLGKPLRPLAAAVLGYGLTAFGILELPISLMYVVFLGFSLPCLLANFFLRTLLRDYGPAPQKEPWEEEDGEGGGKP